MVASKEAGLDLEEKNVQLLALVSVSVFARLPRGCGGYVDAVVRQLSQRYDRASGTVEAHTLLPSGMLLV